MVNLAIWNDTVAACRICGRPVPVSGFAAYLGEQATCLNCRMFDKRGDIYQAHQAEMREKAESTSVLYDGEDAFGMSEKEEPYAVLEMLDRDENPC